MRRADSAPFESPALQDVNIAHVPDVSLGCGSTGRTDAQDKRARGVSHCPPHSSDSGGALEAGTAGSLTPLFCVRALSPDAGRAVTGPLPALGCSS